MAELLSALGIGFGSATLGWYWHSVRHKCPQRVLVAARQVDQKVQPDLSRRQRRELARRKR